MLSPFPGMNPYLENPELWREFHNRMIVAIADAIGWLIDPGEQIVFVYLPNQQPEVLDNPEARLPIPSFARELRLTVGNVFDWLLE